MVQFHSYMLTSTWTWHFIISDCMFIILNKQCSKQCACCCASSRLRGVLMNETVAFLNLSVRAVCSSNQWSDKVLWWRTVNIYLSSLSLCASILQSAPLGQGASRLLQIFCLMRYGIWKALGPARAVALLSISINSVSTARVSWEKWSPQSTAFRKQTHFSAQHKNNSIRTNENSEQW